MFVAPATLTGTQVGEEWKRERKREARRDLANAEEPVR